MALIGINMTWTGQGRVKQEIVPYSYNLDKDFFNNRFISNELTPNSKYPRSFIYTDPYNTKQSDFWLYDASFLRLKNLEVYYNFPQKVLGKLRLQDLRVFFTGTNLFVIDKVKVQDPESNATSTGQSYPLQRVFTFGLNVSF